MKKKVVKTRTLFLLITAFFAGFVVMALEILGFRIFAPHFGYSIYVAGTLISIVMVAMSLGYYWGGKLADRKGDYQTIFWWIFMADLYIFLTLISYKYILQFFSSLLLWGVVLSAFVIFGFPMVVLSMVSPYFTKLIAQQGKVGSAAGNISSISTAGSILGTIVPTFILIPSLGSFFTFFSSAAILLLIVLIYFSTHKKHLLLSSLLLLTIFLKPSAATEGGNVILEKESVYNLIKVVKIGEQYQLRLNDDYNLQSLYDRENLYNPHYYFYYFNIAPALNNAKNVLILGMGAGTSASQMIKLYGVRVDGVEIDPEIVGVSQHYFGLEEVKPNLNIYVDDARPFVKRVNKKYDVIQVDMFHGGFYAPFYVLTREFFEEVEAKLNPGGLVAINVLYPVKSSAGDLLFRSVGNTVASVFTHVYYLNLNHFNVLLFATNENLSLAEVQQRIRENAPVQLENKEVMAQTIQEYRFDPQYAILTDDKAPLEQLTYKALAGIAQ